MKKPILVVVAVIAVLALGLPPIIGGMTRSTIESRIAAMDENPFLSIAVAEYDRGWFGSSARIEVGIDADYAALIGAADAGSAVTDAGEALSEQRLGIGLDVWHGPIILAEGLYLGLSKLHARLDDSDELGAMITEELGIPYVAELHGRLSFTNAFSYTANVPPIEYFDESGQVRFSGLTVTGTTRGGELTGNAQAERLQIDGAAAALTVENFSLSGDSTPVNHFLWAGEFGAAIDRVSYVNPLTGTDSIQLSGVRVDGLTDLNDAGDLFDARVTYAVDELNVPAEEMQLTDSEFTMRFSNLSVAAITRYYETMLSMDLADPGAAAMAIPAIISDLLAHDPSVAFDPVRFTLNGDALTASLSLRATAGDQADGPGGFDLTNVMALLGMFEASANLTAAKTLLESLATSAALAQLEEADNTQLPPGQDTEAVAQAQTDLMIATFLGQGYLVDDGENYSTQIEYANGEVRVNGALLPLGALLQ